VSEEDAEYHENEKLRQGIHGGVKNYLSQINFCY
jgi:hypothetical protein